MDQLKIKWFDPAPCASDIRKPTPLTFMSVSGVFLFLGLGLVLGILILCCERVVFSSVPALRRKSKDSFWKNRKLMFFSQVSVSIFEFSSERTKRPSTDHYNSFLTETLSFRKYSGWSIILLFD